jgi:peptide/nickel transport system substrate-binding protein
VCFVCFLGTLTALAQDGVPVSSTPAATKPALDAQVPEQPVVKAEPEPPAPEKAQPRDAAKPKAGEAAAGRANLASAPAFDVVYIKGRREPVRVQPLPRPFRRESLRPGQTVHLKQYRTERDGGEATIGVKAEEITRVELFEELLAREGDKAMERREFARAFDLFARLVKTNPDWPRAREKLYNVFIEQAEQALARKPPDYDTALALCLQLRAEDRKMPGIQPLMRRACLGRADDAMKANDYATARDQLHLLLQHYPGDADVVRLQQTLYSKAKALADQAQRAMEGTLEEQRTAVGLLATARQIWPDLPDLDRLMLRARRNYPVLNVAVFEEPGTLEPLGAESLAEFQACQLIFDSLFEPDESGGQFFKGPMLAVGGGWSQSDLGLKHRFALARGLRWADGKPVTAYDVESSLRLFLDTRAQNYDPERARFIDIDELQVEDPFALSVALARPHPRPLSLFTIPLLPYHLVVEPPRRGSEFSRAPVGTGPYRIGQPDAPLETKFAANPEFRTAKLGQPYIKEINFHHYVKSSAAVRDMDDGKAHLMTRLDPLETIRFAKLTGQFEVRNYLSNSVYVLALNHRRTPIDDLRLRRAMLLALDRQAILNQYFHAGPGGLAHKVITGPFPTHSPAHDPKISAERRDETLAKQLVEEVKKSGGLLGRTFTLKYPQGDPAVEKAVSQIKKDLQRVGLEVKTEAKIEADLRHEVIDRQDFDLVYWRYDHRNVLYNITALFDPDPEQQKPGGTNFMGYQHPELVKLFSQLRQEQRPLELWEIQREIHRFTNREVVLVPLWQLDNYIAYTSKLTYRQPASEQAPAIQARQVPIHPLYLFRKTEGWYLEP